MKRSISATVLGSFALAVPSALFAASPMDYFDPDGSISGDSGLPTSSVVEFVLNAVGVLLGVLSIVTIILVLYAGFTILTSAGNEDKITQGRKILVWAVIGLLIIFSSLGIVVFLNRFIPS